MDNKEHCARTALKTVAAAGGCVTFDQYDTLMRSVVYFVPITWIAGWGDPVLHKSNNDKLCAFAAVELGLLKQTDTGYTVSYDTSRGADLPTGGEPPAGARPIL